MTVGEVISVTYPDADVQGLVSAEAVFRHVHGLIAHRLSKDTSTARALRAQLRGALNREVGRCQWVVAMSSLNASVGVR